jgi:hypothetical protein
LPGLFAAAGKDRENRGAILELECRQIESMMNSALMQRRARPRLSGRTGIVAGLFAAILAGGCRNPDEAVLPKKAATVSGNVSWNGKPLIQGTIKFVPILDTITTKTVLAQPLVIFRGKYAVPNPPGMDPGPYKVEIHALDIPEDLDGLGTIPDMGFTPDRSEMIPEEFNDKTTLKVDIASGANTFDFNLTGKKRPPAPMKKARPKVERPPPI